MPEFSTRLSAPDLNARRQVMPFRLVSSDAAPTVRIHALSAVVWGRVLCAQADVRPCHAQVRVHGRAEAQHTHQAFLGALLPLRAHRPDVAYGHAVHCQQEKRPLAVFAIMITLCAVSAMNSAQLLRSVLVHQFFSSVPHVL